MHGSLITKKQAIKDGFNFVVNYKVDNDNFCYYTRTIGGASELKQTLIKLKATDIEVKAIA
jgi:hypothetical protein